MAMPSKLKYFEEKKEELISQYVNDKLSLNEIASIHNCNKRTIARYLVRFGVSMRSSTKRKQNKIKKKTSMYDFVFNNM